jgi:hypothetical protein
MSAQDYKQSINLTPTSVSISATGEIGINFIPLNYPVHIRQWAVMPMVSGHNYATGGMSISLMIQSLATGTTASAIYTMTGSTGDLNGVVIIKPELDAEVQPHQRVFMNNNAVISGSPTIQSQILIEPKWERPENFTSKRVIT